MNIDDFNSEMEIEEIDNNAESIAEQFRRSKEELEYKKYNT